MHEHVVVAAVLRKDGEVLLCHRSPERRWYPDVWDFPGGHVIPGELPEQALRRELLEELGVDVGDLRGPILHKVDDQAGLDLALWESRAWTGSVENRQPHEHDAIGWFRADQLDGLDFADPCYLRLLQDLLRDGEG